MFRPVQPAIQEREVMTDVVQRCSATWSNSITWYYPSGIGFVIVPNARDKETKRIDQVSRETLERPNNI